MTFFPPTRSVLLFGGADGKMFFEDVHLLKLATDNTSSERASNVTTRSSRREEQNSPGDDVQWKKLVVSRGSTIESLSPCSPVLSTCQNRRQGLQSIDSRTERRDATFLHPGGGRDYHSMHYVKSSEEEENARGFRVLVIGNVVVATDIPRQGRGTGAESQATGMAFDTSTLRIEELRVKEPELEAQWESRRIDHSSMWKPRARHAHSSVVVGGDQVFVFGGKDATSTTFLNDLFYYDAPLNQWVQPSTHSTGQKPQPRAFAGFTASQDGKTLFLFGGTDGKQEFGSLFLYDVVHSRWDSLAGATMGHRPSCRINHSLTFVAPEHLVLFGGRRRAVRQNELFVYHVRMRTWRLVGNDAQKSDVERAETTPVGRTAHATVLIHSEPAGRNAVQKLLVFGGYAGSHEWLNDLYVLSLPQSALLLPPSGSSSRAPATQHTRLTRSPVTRSRARVALSAPQQLLKTHDALPSDCLQKKATQPSEEIETSRVRQVLQRQEPETEPRSVTSEPSQSEQQRAIALVSPPTSKSQVNAPRDLDVLQRSTASPIVLTDITNQPDSSSQPQQQASIVTHKGAAFPGVNKTYKRRRLAGASQESITNNGIGERTTVHVGIQTMLLQLLQHQPRVEDTLARIVEMLTQDQTVRHQQSMNQETIDRMQSEEQRKLLEAANRRNEALNKRLARMEAERVALHEKLVARETEVCVHKNSLKTTLLPLKECVEAIKASHEQQLTVSREIESKVSAVHDFMEELRHAGEESSDSSQRQQGYVRNVAYVVLTRRGSAR